jgi:hypothetical protein
MFEVDAGIAFMKARRVIKSCKTKSQLEVAERYIELYQKTFGTCLAFDSYNLILSVMVERQAKYITTGKYGTNTQEIVKG